MSVMKIPHLTPKIIEAKLAKYAHSHGQDEGITEVMQEARDFGYMTKGHLIEFSKWKTSSERNRHNCEKNSDEIVKQITRIAFASDCDGNASVCDEKQRIKILRIIYGVGWSMASAILHFAFPDKYPILDENVMDVVGGDENYNFAKWQEYSRICREARVEYGLTMRNLDRVLWQMGDDKKEKKKKKKQ